MQLKSGTPKPRGAGARRQLIAASCALLGSAAARSQDGQPAPAGSGLLDDWSLDTAVAYYHEDGRIQAIEPIVNASKTFSDGEALSLNATFDSLSGSSPNGALTSRQPQTFASPSGTSLSGPHTYTTAAGQLPVDAKYHDQRLAVGANWTTPLTRVTQLSVGGKLSDEHDFLSATVDASIAHDFNDKNTTLSFGISNEYDAIKPIGGAPLAGSDYASLEKTGNKTKDGVGVLIGLTQVMTRNWLSEFNVSVDRFTGYLDDPYKIISVVDAAGNTTGYVFESRPDQRLRKSAYWENRVTWTDQISTALSLRAMADDWGVRSDTALLHLRWSLSNRDRYLEPSLRWYRQSAADFYTPWIVGGEKPASAYESSDSRLAAFRALTYGLKYAQTLPGHGDHAGSEFSVRVEYYQQTFTDQAAGPGTLQGLDLYPSLKAFMVQVGWRF
jgi:hypothetical protein